MLLKSFRNKQGFGTLEYLFVLLAFLFAMVALSPSIRRGYIGQMRKVGEGLSTLRQYGSAKTHECAYEARVYYPDGTVVSDVIYSQACFDHKISTDKCAQRADSQGCIADAKVQCMGVYTCGPGGSGTPPACVPDGSCTANPPCGTTTTGKDNCMNSCTRTGPPCGGGGVNGGWCPWSACAGACPTGNQTRTCTCPAPSGTGANCSGPSSQNCPMTPCCGDGVCNGTENCSTCPGDCPCGGGTCVAGVCSACVPMCGTRKCGPPPNCSGPDYSCPGGSKVCGFGCCNAPYYTCNIAVGCICNPQCVGKNCGGDGCAGSCGPCNSPSTCISGVCTACTPIPCQWGAWSTCTGSGQTCTGTRTRSKTVTESCGGTCSCNGPLCPTTDTDSNCVREGTSWARTPYHQWGGWVTEVYTCHADSSSCPCPINGMCGKLGLQNQNCAYLGYTAGGYYCQDNQCSCDLGKSVQGPDGICHCNQYTYDTGSSCAACSYTGSVYTCGPTPCGTNNMVCPAHNHCWPCDQDGRGGCAPDLARCP